MATQSILYWLKKSINVFAAVVLCTSCATLNEQLQSLTAAPSSFVKEKSFESLAPEEGLSEIVGEELGKNRELEARPVVDGFLQKEIPKLGVILGAGGALAAAHVGVLHELSRAKIPVHGMVGIEWGGLVGGLYSLKGQSHHAEWQLLKFPHQLLTTNSIFSFGQRPKIGQFQSFLQAALGRGRVSGGEIPFACPYVDLSVEKVRWASRGRLTAAMNFCLPSAPLFRLSERSAALAAVTEAYQRLKKQGANLILYVDVLQKNSPLSSTIGERQYLLGQLWLYSKHSESFFVDTPKDFVVLPLDLSGYNISSFPKMRAIIGHGRNQGREFLEDFVQNYGY